MIEEYSIQLDNGMKVHGIKDGEGIPCIIIGPGSVYLPSVPSELKTEIQFITADMYWAKDTNISDERLNHITIREMIDDIDRIRSALGFKQILLIGPSALGLLAMEYARLYPDNTLGVVGLGSPLNTNFESEGELFFDANYNPKKFGGKFATLWSTNKWKANHSANEEYKRYLKENKEKNETKDYMAELDMLEQRLYYNTQVAEPMKELWKPFNITTRKRFFKLIVEYDFTKLKTVEAPILDLLGLHDGLIPSYYVIDTPSDFKPKKFSYFVFEKSAHNPFLDSRRESAQVIVKWMQDHNIKQKFLEHKTKPTICSKL